jgi:hypothetical protein
VELRILTGQDPPGRTRKIAADFRSAMRARGGVALALGVASMGALFLYQHDPASQAELFPLCPVFALTGLACPGCGTLRALYLVMHGDLAGAWRMNALLLVLSPLLLVAVAASIDFVARGRVRRMRLPRRAPKVALGLLAVYMVLRNS